MMWFTQRKARHEAIDAEAISLFEEASESRPGEAYAAYDTDRDLMRLARSTGDGDLESSTRRPRSE